MQPIGRTPITGRIGAAGVFLAYGQGYPTFKTIAVWRVDTGKPQLVLKGNGAKHVSIAAAPEGRLWVMWEVNGKIYATRTNHAATRVGPPSTLGPPGSKSVYELDGEGSAGPLDLDRQRRPGPVAPAGVAQAPGLRQTRGEDHRVHRRGRRGSGCRGQVKVGGKTLTTAANGRATLANAPSGRVKASAAKAGYTAASTTVR